jgi:hypothetical protein
VTAHASSSGHERRMGGNMFTKGPDYELDQVLISQPC